MGGATDVDRPRLSCLPAGKLRPPTLNRAPASTAVSSRIRQDIEGELLKRAQSLLRVPADISRTMKDYTQTAAPMLRRRNQVGDMIEILIKKLGSQPPVR